MAKLLKEHAPEAYQQARAQIGAELRRAGFGENIAGDKPFSQERFNAKLRQMGTARLQAFFTPDEIATLRTAGRVGAYMESPPAGSAVNFSNSGSAVANVAQAAAPGILGQIVGGAGGRPGRPETMPRSARPCAPTCREPPAERQPDRGA
jgi:hypothetical protein